MRESLPTLITIAGCGQLSVLVASALVPVRLNSAPRFAGAESPPAADGVGVRRVCRAFHSCVRSNQLNERT